MLPLERGDQAGCTCFSEVITALLINRELPARTVADTTSSGSACRYSAVVRRLRIVVVSAIALLFGTACSSGEGDDPADGTVSGAVTVATSFHDLVASGEPASACFLLSPSARTELQNAAAKPCPAALADEALPSPGEMHETAQFGSMAQVRYANDVVFLTRFHNGWRVVAAGCTAPTTASGVYDCAVEGS